MNLKPCSYRHADDEGHILCDKIKSGDREVTPNICRACPVAHINCTHLRATLDHQARPPITVRWGNGKSQVWDDFAQDSILLSSAACAEKVIPIHSPRDCAGCALRKPLVNGEQLAVNSQQSTVNRRHMPAAPRVVRRVPISAPIAAISGQPSVIAARACRERRETRGLDGLADSRSHMAYRKYHHASRVCHSLFAICHPPLANYGKASLESPSR